MALNLITITGSFVNPDGRAPSSGKVTATLAATMFNAAQIIPPQQLVGILNGSGSLIGADGVSPFQVLPTDAPGTTPQNLTYAFVVTVDGIQIESFSANVPYNAVNGTIDISQLIPLAVLPPAAAYIPSQQGQASGQGTMWNGSAWVPQTFDLGGVSAAETTRATAAETTLSNQISGEITRAQAAEIALTSGKLLARVSYAPSTPVTYTAALGPNLVALDTTNLAITFTTAGSGPGSTEVVVRLQAGVNGAARLYWGLTGTGAPTTGYQISNSLSNSQLASLDFPVTGLTPNTTYTWNFAAYASVASTATIAAGSAAAGALTSNAYPASMKVFAGIA
jgi:hypothetical protein